MEKWRESGSSTVNWEMVPDMLDFNISYAGYDLAQDTSSLDFIYLFREISISPILQSC